MPPALDVHVLITFEYVMWKGGIKIADKIKFANQMTLHKKGVLGYPGGCNRAHL